MALRCNPGSPWRRPGSRCRLAKQWLTASAAYAGRTTRVDPQNVRLYTTSLLCYWSVSADAVPAACGKRCETKRMPFVRLATYADPQDVPGAPTVAGKRCIHPGSFASRSAERGWQCVRRSCVKQRLPPVPPLKKGQFEQVKTGAMILPGVGKPAPIRETASGWKPRPDATRYALLSASWGGSDGAGGVGRSSPAYLNMAGTSAPK